MNENGVLDRFPIQANIPVTDLDKARTFYSDVLGLELVEDVSGEGLHYRCGGGTWLEVFRTRAGVGSGHTEAGFQVTGIEGVVADLRSRGVVFQEHDLGDGLARADGILTWGEEKAAWFTDPEGNVIGIFQSASTERR